MRHRQCFLYAFQFSQKRISVSTRALFSSKATTNGSNHSSPSGSSDYWHSHCPYRDMREALPDLKARFDKLAEKNGDGVFPILSPHIVEKLNQRWDPNDHERRAAVLIPLFMDYNGKPSILFTARSKNMPVNPSEISFVGGHKEEGDTTLEKTALREAQEELLGDYPWNTPEKVVVLGRGTTIPAINGIPVTPIIAVMLEGITQPMSDVFPGCPNEVDAVFGMSVAELLQTEDSHHLPNHRLLGKDQYGPFFPSPHGDIWGLTAFMLRPLLHKLYKPVFKLRRK